MENSLLTSQYEINGFQPRFEPYQSLSSPCSEPNQLPDALLSVFGFSKSVPSPCFPACSAQASLRCSFSFNWCETPYKFEIV